MSAMSELWAEINELVENDVDPLDIVIILMETYNMDHRTAQKFVTDVVNHNFELKNK